MSTLLRPALRAFPKPAAGALRPLAGRRMAHHAAEYKNIPFGYENRGRFAAKMIAYLGFGFALPFVAVGWQWYKPGGYKNSK